MIYVSDTNETAISIAYPLIDAKSVEFVPSVIVGNHAKNRYLLHFSAIFGIINILLSLYILVNCTKYSEEFLDLIPYITIFEVNMAIFYVYRNYTRNFNKKTFYLHQKLQHNILHYLYITIIFSSIFLAALAYGVHSSGAYQIFILCFEIYILISFLILILNGTTPPKKPYSQ